MDEPKSKFLRKLRQIEEHARALTAELPPGEAQNRARLIWGLAAHLVTTYMENQQTELLKKLREIEDHSKALTQSLPAGVSLHRTRLIQATAAHLALQVELEGPGGHLLDAANDAARSEKRTPA